MSEKKRDGRYERNDGSTGTAMLCRIPEAATELGVSVRTVNSMVSAGELPVVRLPGTGRKALVRITREDLIALIARCRRSA